MKSRFVLPILLALILSLSACAPSAPAAQGPAIVVMNPWVRAVGGMGGMDATSALFMVIQNNGSAVDTLLKAESDAAGMVQIHISEINADGVSSMREVDGIEIPAGGSVELMPGGYHVMLMGLKRELKAGDTITFILTFKIAGTVTIEAPVKNP